MKCLWWLKKRTLYVENKKMPPVADNGFLASGGCFTKRTHFIIVTIGVLRSQVSGLKTAI